MGNLLNIQKIDFSEISLPFSTKKDFTRKVQGKLFRIEKSLHNCKRLSENKVTYVHLKNYLKREGRDRFCFSEISLLIVSV